LNENLSIKFKIGGFVIALISSRGQGNFDFTDRYKKFLSNEIPDIIFNILFGNIPDLKGWDLVFDSGGLWKMYLNENRWGVNLYTSPEETHRSCAVIFKQEFCYGDVFLPDNHQAENNMPYSYPLAEVHMINLLSQGHGVLAHACAVKDGEHGILFAGISGAGKSTTAKLWDLHSRAAILSDDRAIIRKKNGKFWLYGTPWHGTARFASPDVVPLTRIYFLRHSLKNQITPIKTSDAYKKLLVRCFPTFWNAEGMEFTMGFLKEMVQAVPCYDLEFVPDGSAVDFVRCHY